MLTTDVDLPPRFGRAIREFTSVKHARPVMKTTAHFFLVCFLAIALNGCGNNKSSNYTPPPPAVSITISATTATVQTTGYNDPNANTFQFTAAVQNATDTTVTWDLNGQPAGSPDAGFGTISAAGLYTAPMMIPNGSVEVRATASADTTKKATAAITLVWAAQLYNLQVASSVETSSSTPIQLFFDTYGPKDLTWTVNGAEMGTPMGGAISLDYTRVEGNYIAPATIPASPVQIAVTLKSNKKSLSRSVTIIPNSNPSDPTVTITPSSVTLQPGAVQSFAAAVTNNGNPVAGAVTWEAGSYSGGTSHLLTDGIIKGDGTYTAPYDPPDNRVVVVNAYYGSAYVPKTGYAIVTLADPAQDPNQRLNGQYAFSFHDSQYLSTAFGTLVADGHGSLIGTMDLVTSQGTLSAQSFTGSYTAHADGRVQATITYAAGGQSLTQPITLMLVSDNRAYASTSGSMGTLTGTIEKQDTTAFNAAELLGDYGFLLNGSAFAYVNQSQMANPYAGAGVITLYADGSVSGAATWEDSAGVNNDSTIGSYTFDNTTGRGTLSLPTGTGTNTHLNFAVISASKLLLGSADQLPTSANAVILQGWAERRTLAPPLAAVNLTGPFAFYVAGRQWLEAGHFSADGAGGIQGLLDMRDTSSNAPIPKLTWAEFEGTYSVGSSDASFNRGRLHFSYAETSTNPPFQEYATFYMIAPDRLIILMDSMVYSSSTGMAGEAFLESPSTGAPDNNRYAVHFVDPDFSNYATGWTVPLDQVVGTQWVGWRDTNISTKNEWELYASGQQLSDVYTWGVLIGNGAAFPNLRAYAISPSKLMLIGLDMGYSAPNEFIWMEELQNSAGVDASSR
jgi:hypothetical protein